MESLKDKVLVHYKHHYYFGAEYHFYKRWELLFMWTLLKE